MPRIMRLSDDITPGRRVVPSDLHQLRSTLSQIGLFDRPVRSGAGPVIAEPA